jgi:thioredoxin reductase (NADPH)
MIRRKLALPTFLNWSLLLLLWTATYHSIDARPVVRNIQSTHGTLDESVRRNLSVLHFCPFCGWSFSPRCSYASLTTHTHNTYIYTIEFDRLLKKHATETGLPVIVDFYSDSCGPCRMMAPIFKSVASSYIDKAVFVKIDTNRQQELSSRYQIRSLPTFQYYLFGKKAHQDVGGIGEQSLRQQTDSMIRQAQAENILLPLDALVDYYKEQDATKSLTDVQSVHDKCVSMVKGQSACVGAAANQLLRRLKKKYNGQIPKTEPRFVPLAPTNSTKTDDDSQPKSSKERTPSSTKNAPEQHNLHLATLEDLQIEIERRLDEQRDQMVDAEDADDDESDPSFHIQWDGPGLFPERLIIVGGGPAGMAAAIYGARAGLRPLVIAPSMGGQLQGKGVEVENYPGLFNQTGPSVIAAMRLQAAHFGAVFEDDTIHAVIVDRDPAMDFMNGGKPTPIRVVTNQSGTIETHSLIIATGAEANWLNIPGEWDLRGGGVSSCAVCDGFLYGNRDVIVVGGGDAAMEDALVLARTSKSVTIVHRRDQFRASKVLADRVINHPLISVIWNSTVQEILGQAHHSGQSNDEEELVDIDAAVEKTVSGVIIKTVSTGETKQLRCDAVFVAIGHTPNTDFLKNVVTFDPAHNGYVLVGKGTTQTSVKGIFAAGDVSDAIYRQAITSAGSGAAAALDAERYLSEHGLGNEDAELEAELLADLMMDQQRQQAEAESVTYNVYEDAGGRMEGMKESMAAEL